MDALAALGLAGANMANANLESELTTAVTVFNLIGAAFPLNNSWSTQLNVDQQLYFRDSLATAEDPSYAAKAAADYAKYQVDSGQMQIETNEQGQHLQDEKTEIRILGNGMSAVYNLEMPIEQIARGSKDAIIRLMMG